MPRKSPKHPCPSVSIRGYSRRPAGSWLLASGFSRRLHDDKGAISVLVLLTIWCLVAIIAMIWNQVEYAQKKQTLQAAADSTAESATVWTTRATNAISAQNM